MEGVRERWPEAELVFVLGSFVVDAAFRTARMPAAGETVVGQSFGLGPGGKGSNQAVAAARAGARVALQTVVGGDAFGQLGRDLWMVEGIDAGAVKMVDAATGSAAILLDEGTGANRIIVVPGACDKLGAADVEEASESIGGAKVFLAQLELPLAAVAHGLELARRAGVITILNPAPAPVVPVPREVMQQVEFLVPNETEAARMTGMEVNGPETAEQAARQLQAAGATNVVVTLGERGALFLDCRGRVEVMEAFRFGAVRDTTGAGDAFCGAFAAGVAEGMEPSEALRFGSAAAGLSVLRQGAASSMPRRNEIEAALAKGRSA